RTIIYARRSPLPLNFTVVDGENSKNLQVTRTVSPFFWGNLAFGYVGLVGMLVDFTNDKRFSYPSTLYVDMGSNVLGYSTNPPLTEDQFKRKNILKVTPLKMIGLFNPAVGLSYERLYKKNHSSQLAFSIPLAINFNRKQELRGYRLAYEHKYYFNQNQKRWYVAFELGHSKESFLDSEEYHWEDEKEQSYFYTNKFTVQETAYTFVPKIGFQYYLNDHFLMDVYLGIGPKREEIKFPNGKALNDESLNGQVLHLYATDYTEGNIWAVSIPFNVKVGFVF
ncbi:DUF3575 domain-containing protein, partial [Xanthovirga aplysinae]|uniref:DUF3575 domain-containing protein n=1 Tax=Xanthovirga aplysinae TaxID=2529853 RepID=UPI0012BC692A